MNIAEQQTKEEFMLTGKKLSILGDSVSTYKGVSNDGQANATIICNHVYYDDPFPLKKTYWYLVMKEFGMELCVNNSWSGGNLSGQHIPAAGVNRANYLSRDDGAEPDFIIVFMGLNDLGRNVPIDIFSADYEKTLLTIKEKHPNAKVCCINMPDRDPDFKARTVIFNDAISKAVETAGENFFIADFFNSRMNNDDFYNNTVDGLHPDEDGMRMIAEVVSRAIKKNIK